MARTSTDFGREAAGAHSCGQPRPGGPVDWGSTPLRCRQRKGPALGGGIGQVQQTLALPHLSTPLRLLLLPDDDDDDDD
eukprot:8470867-Alexandrium_andersonii.AAC.1